MSEPELLKSPGGVSHESASEPSMTLFDEIVAGKTSSLDAILDATIVHENRPRISVGAEAPEAVDMGAIMPDGATAGEWREDFEKRSQDYIKHEWPEHLYKKHGNREIEIHKAETFLDEHRRADSLKNGKASVRFIGKCRCCGTELPKSCPDRVRVYVSPLTGKLKRDTPFACPSCKSNPWDDGAKRAATLYGTIVPDWQPYVDITKGADGTGAKYGRDGALRGFVITSREHGREFARRNNLRLKPRPFANVGKPTRAAS